MLTLPRTARQVALVGFAWPLERPAESEHEKRCVFIQVQSDKKKISAFRFSTARVSAQLAQV